DERYATAGARLRNNDELMAIFYGWAAGQNKKEVYARAGRLRGPVAYVHTIEDLFSSPQLRERSFLQEVDHPIAGRLTYPGAPFRMSASPWRPGRAPLLGEHTGEVSGAGPHPPTASPRVGQRGGLADRIDSSSPRPALGDGSGMEA